MPRHGIVRQVTPLDRDIFKGFKNFEATNYHSLHIDIGQNLNTEIDVLTWTSSQCPSIRPLAWDTTDVKNGTVLLSARHIDKPFWGVQYHPESICTSGEGSRIISAWWTAAVSWLVEHQRPVLRSRFPRLRRQIQEQKGKCSSSELADKSIDILQDANLLPLSDQVDWRILQHHVRDVNSISNKLRLTSDNEDEAIVFRSGKQKDGTMFGQGLGRFSIIGIIGKDTLHVQYDVQSQRVKIHQRSAIGNLPTSKTVKDIFAYIKQFMSHLQVSKGLQSVPFWGGLMGYISYEAGLETIDVLPEQTMNSEAPLNVERPDINFALVTRSIVIDHVSDTIYVQSIRDKDADWLEGMLVTLQSMLEPISEGHDTIHQASNGNDKHVTIGRATASVTATTPTKTSYIKKILKCSASIRAGDSYELCLTSQTKVVSPRSNSLIHSGWALYERLSTTNTAPFSSFIRLHSPSDAVTIISSSPERFLSWSRSGQCQFRPIKGTVKKAPGVTYKDAQEILESSKERAENLMITDLIRHDLHGVAQLGTVEVPKLMQIEEYATVYQLVSVIEGDISNTVPSDISSTNSNNGVPNGSYNKSMRNLGIDLLAASLPPGSMTGAPKRRSCQLISQYEENKPRGIYSGVLGYLDAGGGADFAVVIRTAVRWDKDGEGDVWSVGAGGAITAQSNTEDEFAEMITKLDSTLGAFGLKGDGSPL